MSAGHRRPRVLAGCVLDDLEAEPQAAFPAVDEFMTVQPEPLRCGDLLRVANRKQYGRRSGMLRARRVERAVTIRTRCRKPLTWEGVSSSVRFTGSATATIACRRVVCSLAAC